MERARRRADGGYAMAALLVTLAVMSVILGVAMPVWRTVVQREKEEELVFRGRQYARAIALYQRKYAASYPASLDVLIEQKFLRKKFKDPMVKDGEFEIIYQGTLAQRQAALAGRGATSPGPQAMTGGLTGQGRGTQSGQPPLSTPGSAFGSQSAGPQGGVVGVASKSKEKSIRILDGKSVYNEWQFVFVPAQATGRGAGGRAGTPGQGQPGPQRGRGPGGASGPFSQPPVRR
jgi:type II secretory pathway pseudopilin PulG